MNATYPDVAECIVGLLSRPAVDADGNPTSPHCSLTPPTLKALLRIVPMTQIRRSLNELCDQGIIKPNGYFNPYSEKRQMRYTIAGEAS